MSLLTGNNSINTISVVDPSDLVLVRQTTSDLSVAYEILTSRTSELIERETGQYTAPYPPKKQYAARTDSGQNWFVRNAQAAGNPVVGIVSMIPQGGVADWREVTFPSTHLWLSSLFVSPRWKSRNVGPSILEVVKKYARNESFELILLDCYVDSGFLESFYKQNGFETVATQTFTFGPRSFKAALMCFNLQTDAQNAK